jgi:hypothetical protein
VDSLFENEEVGEVVFKKIKEISESPNFFVFLEGKLNKREFCMGIYRIFSKKIQ